MRANKTMRTAKRNRAEAWPQAREANAAFPPLRHASAGALLTPPRVLLLCCWTDCLRVHARVCLCVRVLALHVGIRTPRAHIAPTAPDTLPCFPFDDKDPFVMEETPDVFFAGNQPRLETGVMTWKEASSGAGAGAGKAAPSQGGVGGGGGGGGGGTCRLVALPSFAKTGTVVLVNLRDLACHPLTFSTAAFED